LLVGGEDQENTQIEKKRNLMKLLLLHRLRELRMFRLKKKKKFNETVTASSSSGASNVHISDELRVTSGICFSNLTNCNVYFNSK
jgi:hypothetical protein